MRKSQSKELEGKVRTDILSRHFLNSLPEGRTRASQTLVKSVLESGVSANVFSIGYPFNSKHLGKLFWQVTPRIVGVSESLGLRYPPRLQTLFDIFTALTLNPALDGEILYLVNLNAYLYSSIIRPIQGLLSNKRMFVMHAFHPVLPETSRFMFKQYIWLLRKGVIDHVFSINKIQRRHFSNYLPEERVHHIPYPVDTQKFKPRDMMRSRELFNLPADKEVIGYVGHLGRSRGILDILHAFSKLDDQRDKLLALTYSPFTNRDDLQAFTGLSEKLGVTDRVQFINPVVTMEHYFSRPDEYRLDIELFYNAVDLMVLPFQRPYLSIDPPLTIIESLASGTPLVTTSVGAVKHMIDEDDALFIPPQDVDGIANGIQLLLEDDAYRKKLSSNARRYATTNLSVKVIAGRIREAFEKILE